MKPNAIARNTETGAEVPCYVELDCTITGPDGQQYTASGSMMTPDLIIAYTKDTPNPHRGTLTTWKGEPIGTFTEVSRWKQIAPYGCAFPYTMRAIHATIDGAEWHGRQNIDGGNYVKLRPCTTGK